MEKIKELNGYKDIEIDFEGIMAESGLVMDMLHLNDLKQRKLYLNEGIDKDSVMEIIQHIIRYNVEDKGKDVEKRKPILLYVTSNGGSVDAGYELIDMITASKTPVYTVNLGFQYSMGFLIGIAGHKRFAMPNAKFLHHDGYNAAYDSGSKVQDRIKFDARVDDRTKEYVLSRSNITPDEYDANLRVEWYMFADEAKQKGFVDYIIGEDCDMDAII